MMAWQRLVLLVVATFAAPACTFKFDLTSQRTALENQVMGSYKELEDDLVLVSSVRAEGKSAAAPLSEGQKKALLARQNQDFNRDDVDELKTKELIGETSGGVIALLPPSLSQAAKANGRDAQLAKTLVDEENRDRALIWQRIIDSNENLSAKDLPDVRRTYAKMQREAASAGQWVQNDSGQWQRKDVSTQ